MLPLKKNQKFRANVFFPRCEKKKHNIYLVNANYWVIFNVNYDFTSPGNQRNDLQKQKNIVYFIKETLLDNLQNKML